MLVCLKNKRPAKMLLPRLFTKHNRIVFCLKDKMFSRLKNLNKIFVTALVPGFKNDSMDIVDVNTKTAKKMLEEFENQKQTGMDRLYLMFSTDEFGEPSPEIVNVGNVMMLSIVAGGIIGGFLRSRNAFLDFVERNDATSFSSHLEAKQKLQDKVTVGFARGAIQFAWRLTAFTGIYTLTSTTLSVYRGKNGILEHLAAGLVTGAVYKSNLGLRGIVVGGSLGMALGLFAGFSFWVIYKTTGVSLDDAIKFSYLAKKKRDDAYKGMINEYMKSKEPEIVLQHDQKPGITESLDKLGTKPSK